MMRGSRKPPVSVRATAIRMLARREYSFAELTQRLVRRGADAAEVEVTLVELQQLGFVSDERYAHALVTQMSPRFAKRSIMHAMREKHVEPDAQATVEDELAVIDDASNARALLVRRFPQPAADDREKARQVRFLQSRGYGLSLILQLLRDRASGALADTDDGDA